METHRALLQDIVSWAEQDRICQRFLQTAVSISVENKLPYLEQIAQFQFTTPTIAARYFSCHGLPIDAGQIDLVLADEDLRYLSFEFHKTREKVISKSISENHPIT